MNREARDKFNWIMDTLIDGIQNLYLCELGTCRWRWYKADVFESEQYLHAGDHDTRIELWVDHITPMDITRIKLTTKQTAEFDRHTYPVHRYHTRKLDGLMYSCGEKDTATKLRTNIQEVLSTLITLPHFTLTPTGPAIISGEISVPYIEHTSLGPVVMGSK